MHLRVEVDLLGLIMLETKDPMINPKVGDVIETGYATFVVKRVLPQHVYYDVNGKRSGKSLRNWQLAWLSVPFAKGYRNDETV